MKYLYGASVQGIQDFIFETNKLVEIVGASEIVEHICTGLFQTTVQNFDEHNLIIGAAGNIKYLFNDEKECQNLVLVFPKKVMEIAPHITISQAVVKVEGELTNEAIEQLEKRLKAQRSKRVVNHNLGLMISERSRRTGKPAVKWDLGSENVKDLGQVQKEHYARNSRNRLHEKILNGDQNWANFKFPTEIEAITQGKDRSWIAVIHADGNDLGRRIINMGKHLTVGNVQQGFRSLSLKLDEATSTAVEKALKQTINPEDLKSEELPLRPIVLGGDDMTMIIRGDLALNFTHHFLKLFEQETKNVFADFEEKYGISDFNNGLSACAGIAYIKPNYPFHYGVKLAEELCKYAKKIAKELAREFTPSCLSFHKVHSSFMDDYEDIIEQELKTKEDIYFNYGPYFLHKQDEYSTVDKLKTWVQRINETDAPKSSLRNWLTELTVNKERAHQQMERIKSKTDKRYVRDLNLDEMGRDHQITHLFDVLSLSNIETQ